MTITALTNKLLEVFGPYLKKKIKKVMLKAKETLSNNEKPLANEVEKEAYILEEFDVRLI